MRTIIASDIHGITPELRTLMAPLGDRAIFLSPWAKDECTYRNEQDAVKEFLTNNGIERYAKKIALAARGQPALLVGFSVGATSTWLHVTSSSCNPGSVAYLIYGSRIRDHLSLTPKCNVSAIFAEHEASFEPLELVNSLNQIKVRAEIIGGTSHGFMNPNHPAYDSTQSAAQLAILTNLQSITPVDASLNNFNYSKYTNT